MGNPRPEPRKAALWRGSVLDVRMSGCVEVGRERGSQACGRSAADFLRRTFFHSTSPNDRKDLLVLFSLLWSAGINVPLFFPRRAVAALVSDGHFTLFSVPH